MVVLAYVLKGGLSSAIYTEVLQFFLIVLGFAPLVILVQGLGMFTVGDSYKDAATVRDIYIDDIKIMAGARQLSGRGQSSEASSDDGCSTHV